VEPSSTENTSYHILIDRRNKLLKEIFPYLSSINYILPQSNIFGYDKRIDMIKQLNPDPIIPVTTTKESENTKKLHNAPSASEKTAFSSDLPSIVAQKSVSSKKARKPRNSIVSIDETPRPSSGSKTKPIIPLKTQSETKKKKKNLFTNDNSMDLDI
jgi:hypothetical protein